MQLNKLTKPKLTSTLYLQSITDDFGVWQHAIGKKIDRKHGYALDDTARGLIVFLKYGLLDQARVCLKYLEISLEDGLFVGFFNEQRQPIVFPSSEDAHGLAVWALSEASNHKSLKQDALRLLKLTDKKPLHKPGLTRPLCYALLAAESRNDKAETEKLAKDLVVFYDKKMHWFEEYLRYANGALSLALIKSKKPAYLNIGLDSLGMLDETMRIGVFPAPPGNRKWFKLGSVAQDNYGQQPIDAAFMVMACVAAYQHTGQKKWSKAAEKWMEWFFGNNTWLTTMVDKDGACYDGLDEHGPHKNCGSESTIMYLLAQHEYQKLKIH